MSIEKRDNNYNATLRARCRKELIAFVRKAANRKMMTDSEYVRRAVIDRLISDGIDPAGG